MKAVWITVLVSVFLFNNASMAGQKEISLLLMPREENTAIQIGKDLASTYPLLLVCYKVTPKGVFLHGWTKKEWVPISGADYLAGHFFDQQPLSTLIVEKEGQPVPDTLIPPNQWSPKVVRITTSESRPLLHLLGANYDFTFKQWKWYAKRYHQTIDSINPDGLNVKWYNRQGKDYFRSSKKLNFFNDEKFWVVARKPVILVPEIEEPATVSEDIVVDAEGDDIEAVEEKVNMDTLAEEQQAVEDDVAASTEGSRVIEGLPEKKELEMEKNPFEEDIAPAKIVDAPTINEQTLDEESP